MNGKQMTDAFDTLGVAPAFDLDLARLERLHRDLSRALHPDRHVDEGPRQRRAVLNRAIEVNEAWRTLRDPVWRAEALLTRRGVPVGETHEPAADPELLMEMMEQREELADARRARDQERLGRLTRGMREREKQVLAQLAARFEQLLATDTGEHRTAVLRALGELRYVARFLEEAAAIEDDLF